MKNLLTVDDIVRVTGGNVFSVDDNFRFNGVSIDSRTVSAGDIFVPILGDNFDGHDFIFDAVKKGAKGVIFSNRYRYRTKVYKLEESLGLILEVPDTLIALGEIARLYVEKINPKVITITGSAGKTTTKNFIYSLLCGRYKTHKNKGNQNNRIGVPVNILKAPADCEILLMEIGTSQPGEINILSDICKPDIGILINIGPSHLEGLKSLQGIKKEKISMFNNLKYDGTALVNTDFVSCSEIHSENVITFGFDNNADIKAHNVKFFTHSMEFKVTAKKYWRKTESFKVNFLNKEYIYNILVAIAVSILLDIEKHYIKEKLREFKWPKGRFNFFRLKNDIVLVDDTYNSNPLSLRCSLGGISKLNRRKIVVLGDMLELGKDSAYFHTEAGGMVAENHVDFLYVIGKYSEFVKEGAVSGGLKKENVLTYTSLVEVENELKSRMKEKDLILLKASRGVGLDRLAGRIRERYS